MITRWEYSNAVYSYNIPNYSFITHSVQCCTVHTLQNKGTVHCILILQCCTVHTLQNTGTVHCILIVQCCTVHTIEYRNCTLYPYCTVLHSAHSIEYKNCTVYTVTLLYGAVLRIKCRNVIHQTLYRGCSLIECRKCTLNIETAHCIREIKKHSDVRYSTFCTEYRNCKPHQSYVDCNICFLMQRGGGWYCIIILYFVNYYYV